MKRSRLSLSVVPRDALLIVLEFLPRKHLLPIRKVNKEFRFLFEKTKAAIPYLTFFRFLSEKNANQFGTADNLRIQKNRKSLISHIDSVIDILKRLRRTIEAQDSMYKEVKRINDVIQGYILSTDKKKNEFNKLLNYLEVEEMFQMSNSYEKEFRRWTSGPQTYTDHQFHERSLKVIFSISDEIKITIECYDKEEDDERNFGLKISATFKDISSKILSEQEERERYMGDLEFLFLDRKREGDELDEVIDNLLICMADEPIDKMRVILGLKELESRDLKKLLIILSTIFLYKADIGT